MNWKMAKILYKDDVNAIKQMQEIVSYVFFFLIFVVVFILFQGISISIIIYDRTYCTTNAFSSLISSVFCVCFFCVFLILMVSFWNFIRCRSLFRLGYNFLFLFFFPSNLRLFNTKQSHGIYYTKIYIFSLGK